MSLQYCSQHERLFVQKQNAWLDFSQENILYIRGFCELLRAVNADFSDFEVIEVPCDRCAEEFEQLDPGQ